MLKQEERRLKELDMLENYKRKKKQDVIFCMKMVNVFSNIAFKSIWTGRKKWQKSSNS